LSVEEVDDDEEDGVVVVEDLSDEVEEVDALSEEVDVAVAGALLSERLSVR
jgi:hypothetical protein